MFVSTNRKDCSNFKEWRFTMSYFNYINIYFVIFSIALITYGEATRYRRDIEKCSEEKFQCQSGQCIDLDAVCDGKADCPDHSDEVKQWCSRINPAGKANIKNNSEKNVTPVVIPNSSLNRSCVVPTYPTHGKFTSGSKLLIPGEYVANFFALITSCDHNYQITPPESAYPICVNGKLSSSPLGCSRYCKSAISTSTTRVTCTHGSKPLENCMNPVEGTIIKITCNEGFETSSEFSTTICRDGSWGLPISVCHPVCGQKMVMGKPNILQGFPQSKSLYPWHAGIYDSAGKHYLCGASIISPKIIISAAHCFFSNSDGTIYPKENYLIAVGKFYSAYNDTRDSGAQYATIHSIHVPNRFKGNVGNYEADVAVIVLVNPLEITVSVQPVCVDWTNDFEYQQLSDNNYGVITGWGYTKGHEELSEKLKELKIPYISYDKCFSEVPMEFKKFLTYDKFCTGSVQNGDVICVGDGGGGISFPRKSNDRFYLRGIVSSAPISSDSCPQYSTHTAISKYIEFIRNLEVAHRI